MLQFRISCQMWFQFFYGYFQFFDYNPLMATCCTSLLTSNLFFKTFELQINFLENIGMLSNLFFFPKYDKLRKVIWNKEELWVVWRFAQMLVNVL